MNIFVISEDTLECAKMLDDRRVIKMTTETAQMLSDAIGIHGGEPFYKTCNPNHPCTRWVSRTRSNFLWAVSLLHWLNVEYMTRYLKDRPHGAYLKALDSCFYYSKIIPAGDRTPFQNSSLFKDEPDVFLAYQKTMIYKWTNYKREPRWTNSRRPEWAT